MYNNEKIKYGCLLRDLDESDNRIRILEKEKENMSEKFELESRIQTLEIENNMQKLAMNFFVNEFAPGLVKKYGKDVDRKMLPYKSNHSDDMYPFE